jgi:hypothetical protein
MMKILMITMMMMMTKTMMKCNGTRPPSPLFNVGIMDAKSALALGNACSYKAKYMELLSSK